MTEIKDDFHNPGVRVFRCFFLLMSAAFFSACSTLSPSSSSRSDSEVLSPESTQVKSEPETLGSSKSLPRTLPVKSSAHVSQPQERGATKGKKRSSRWSPLERSPSTRSQSLGGVPIEMNKYVKKWLNYFQGRGKPHMRKYLARSTRYKKLMKAILRDHGLPEELFWVALIESGFNSRAYSRAAAVGYWQFMRGTGRQYGLRINARIDERRDPVLSTRAAAQYLKGIYTVFGSWYLAIASYNGGDNRVKGVVMRNHTRDFWELVRRKKLHPETLNYVPKFIAARLIGENPAQYGFKDVPYQAPIQFTEIRHRRPFHLSELAKKLRLPLKELKALNPALRGDYVPVGRSGLRRVRVPVDKGRLASRVLEKMRHVRHVARQIHYKVRRGDTLMGIARKFGTSLGQLRRANGFHSRSVLRTGSVLKIPQRGLARRVRRDLRGESHKARRRTSLKRSARVHTVRRGENLFSIARKYGTSVASLQRLNGLKRRTVIRVGQKLRVRGSQYTVVRGDTLLSIAHKHGTSLSALRAANRLGSRSKILVGSRLVIPD